MALGSIPAEAIPTSSNLKVPAKRDNCVTAASAYLLNASVSSSFEEDAEEPREVEGTRSPALQGSPTLGTNRRVDVEDGSIAMLLRWKVLALQWKAPDGSQTNEIKDSTAKRRAIVMLSAVLLLF